MKKFFLSIFCSFLLSFCATAQYSLGINTYYNTGDTGDIFGGFSYQFALGITASNQISTYFDTQLKVTGVFSREVNPFTFSASPYIYEPTPSSIELSYAIRVRPLVKRSKRRITLGTGVLYRNLYRLSRSTPLGTFIPLTENFNRGIGILLNIGVEFDLNKNFTLSLEQENRFFINPFKIIQKSKTISIYHGMSLNLVYHLFAKKT